MNWKVTIQNIYQGKSKRTLSKTRIFTMDIQNSTIADIDEIFLLYKVATELQKAKQVVLWPEFDRALIENEIHENRQWKMLIDNEIACIWASTFSDPLIWGKRNIDPAVYIHRIATNPSFRGRKLVSEIVDWAIKYAKSYNKQFIRMDTVVTMKN